MNKRLGFISATYESNGDPACVSSGKGDAGGVSYGEFQFASKTGSADAFVKSNPTLAARFYGMKAGTQLFSDMWKKTAKELPTFGDMQWEYIKSKFYDVAAAKIKTAINVDINTKSFALQNVLWSTAVQHGPQGATNIFTSVYKTVSTKATESDIIKAIYAERGAKKPNGSMKYFSKCSPAVQQSVSNRFVKECKDALAIL